MLSSQISSFVPVLIAAASAAPVLALPPDQVASKLDSIIVFAPVNTTASGQLQPVTFKLDGESRSVYFAAFSPAAVQQVIKERIAPQNPELVKSIKFAPFSLAKFDATVQPTLQRDKNSRVIYIPDPDQVSITEKLLVQQGSNQADAVKVATVIPAVFCPQPAIKATPNSGPLKGQSFIPCSTDYQTVQGMVDKGIASSPELKKSSPKVVAIPMTAFAAMLAKGSVQDVGEIRVLPSPASLKAIDQLRANSKPASAPAAQ
jgi:hypothetical protein